MSVSDNTVVIDNGTGSIYAGLADEDGNPFIIPNCSGSGTHGFSENVNFIDLSSPERYSNYVKSVTDGDLKVTYPMEHGVVKNWDSMEEVWNYVFSKTLNIKPEDNNICITEPIMNPRTNREKMAETLFEKFRFQGAHFPHSAILPLYASGMTTGLVLDCGEGMIQAVPVWGGYPIVDAMMRSDFGGREVTQRLGSMLQECGLPPKPFEVLELIKEKACFITPDVVAAAELSEGTKETFKLPDGEIFHLGNERFECAEMLFNPSLGSFSDKMGLHEILYKCIMKTNIDIRKDLYRTIVLSGGTTLIPGLKARLNKEISALVPPKATIAIRADSTRRYSTWRGAAVLASLASFRRLVIRKREYEEVGPNILRTK